MIGSFETPNGKKYCVLFALHDGRGDNGLICRENEKGEVDDTAGVSIKGLTDSAFYQAVKEQIFNGSVAPKLGKRNIARINRQLARRSIDISQAEFTETAYRRIKKLEKRIRDYNVYGV